MHKNIVFFALALIIPTLNLLGASEPSKYPHIFAADLVAIDAVSLPQKMFCDIFNKAKELADDTCAEVHILVSNDAFNNLCKNSTFQPHPLITIYTTNLPAESYDHTIPGCELFRP